MKWNEWLSSREEKRRNLREAGLDAPPRRATSFNTSERHKRAVFGGFRIPGFARKSAAAIATVLLLSVCGYAEELQLATRFMDTVLYYHSVGEGSVAIENVRIIDGNLSAVEDSSKLSGPIEIPANINGFQVTDIGAFAFSNCTAITSVSIPEGVTNIAKHAFHGCRSLVSVSFPTTLRNVGEYAFSGCSLIGDVSLNSPKVELTISSKAFNACSSLTNISISAERVSVDSIVCTSLTSLSIDARSISFGKSAFQSAVNLKDVTLTSADVNYGESSFKGCSGLESLDISTNVTSIGASAFENCTSVTNVSIADSVQSIGDLAFHKCSSLAKLTLPSSLTTIGRDAFRDCTGLSDVRFAEGKSSNAVIGDYAFFMCDSLTNLVLSSGVSEVGLAAFFGCQNLASVDLSTNLTVIAESAFESCTSLESIVFPQSLKEIRKSAFHGATSLDKFALPKDISVGSSAFADTAYWNNEPEGLVFKDGYFLGMKGSPSGKVEFPGEMKEIPEGLLRDCTNVTEVVFPTNLVSIGAYAFYNTGLKAIELPDTLTKIGEYAFAECTCLASAEYSSDSVQVGYRAFYNTGFVDGVLYAGDDIMSNLQPSSYDKIKTIIIADGVTNIAAEAFMGCAKLETIELPSSVRSIGSEAFKGCSSLWSIAIPAGVTNIPDRAFYGCSSLTNVTFSTNLVSIGVSAFEGTSSLVDFKIPAALSRLGDSSFYQGGYWNAQSDGVVYKDGYILGIKGKCPSALVLPSGLAAIPDGLFSNRTEIVSVTFPSSLRTIGAYSFYGAGLTSVAISDKVQEVGDYAFAYCTSLKKADVTAATAIGRGAFYGTGITDKLFVYGDEIMSNAYPAAYASIEEIVVSGDSTNIVAGAFAGCKSLRSVTIPANITSVATNAFKGCTSVTTVTLGTSLVLSEVFPDSYRRITTVKLSHGATEICDSAFEGCVALTDIDIPYTVEEIGKKAFYGCTGFNDCIVIPENVGSIGDFAFAYCSNLVRVCYYGDCPETVATNIYVGTKTTLCSNVLKFRSGWVDESSGGDDDDGSDEAATNSTATATTVKKSTPGLPSRWPVPKPPGRQIHWWTSADIAKVTLAYQGGSGETTNLYYVANGGRLLEDLPEPDSRPGYAFVGWFTAPYGGSEVTDDYEVGSSMKLYAHWLKDGSGGSDDGDDDAEDDEEDEEDEDAYNFKAASTFHGYLVEDDALCGIAEVKIAKGSWNSTDEETNAVVNASVVLLGNAKKLKARGVMSESEGGEVEFSSLDATLSFDYEGGLLKGSFGSAEFVAYDDGLKSSDYNRRSAARAVGDDFSGNYAVVLSTDDNTGYAALSVEMRSNGKARVKGTLPDGTSFSSTSYVLNGYEEGSYTDVVVPVFAQLYRKAGGLGLLLRFSREDDEVTVSVESISALIGPSGEATAYFGDLAAGKVGALSQGEHSVTADISALEASGEMVEDDLSPDGTEFAVAGSRWTFPKADRVKFVRDDESYETTVENGNPAGIKLSYTAKTGSFKGSFKVYSVTESGRSKKRTASVAGVVVDGVGYGTALIKKVGAVPIVLE